MNLSGLFQNHSQRSSFLPRLRSGALIRFCSSLLILLVVMLASPLPSMAAEVLQVRSSTLLQIGDRNRNYSVRLACVAVDPANEQAAVDLLKKAVPRRKRVNLRPEGNEDGVLIARVTPLDTDQDLGLSLVTTGLATQSCSEG
ncbi:thermonuclease [Synechococcus sp. PROS-9-1]|uniref:thermonuclease n=1 Tax=Synechococcus sp. PROS-9-1 TaxID=1968775 RepID=UPI00164712C3|nr:thermonuclease [Synechococcus sp. PROS-9-1]